jgi:ubiquitin thioesterase protein OTUB1
VAHGQPISIAMQVPIRVVYLDNSGKVPADDVTEVPCDKHDFVPTANTAADAVNLTDVPRVTVLYRPGHYDILYAN